MRLPRRLPCHLPCLADAARGLLGALAAGLLACGDGAPADDATAAAHRSEPAQAKVSLESAGANCAYGGSRIEAGFDANGNGLLDAGEVMSVQFACQGAPGATGASGAQGSSGAAGAAGSNALVRIDAEAAGVNCAFGGSRVGAGLDINGNSLLDAGEVSSTRYVCAGASGAAGGNGTNGSNGANGSNGSNRLIAITTEAPGANCEHGGKKVTTGIDSNADQVLAVGEVASTTYLCHAAPGANLAWVQVAGTAQAMQVNTGYITSAAALTTLTLPASPALGDVVVVNGLGAGGWKLAQNGGQFITARGTPNDGPAGLAWAASGPTLDWQAITSSADGTRLLAAPYPGPLYTSSDAGATWTARESSRLWSGVASSADGNQLVAVVYGGQIHTSSDSGSSWTARESTRQWLAVASSADGTRLVAAVYGGNLYTSTDAGATWAARDSARNWTAVASSEDGTRLVATVLAGQIYTSSDSGASWAPSGPSANWSAVASSADGSKLVASAESGQIHTSTDAGATWTARAATRYWRSVASSADGSKLFAAAEGDTVYGSADGGLTWAARGTSGAWRAVAVSANGGRLAAAGQGTQVQRSIGGRSTVGSGGGLAGSQYDTLTLQYIGGGEFIPIDYSAAGAFHVD